MAISKRSGLEVFLYENPRSTISVIAQAFMLDNNSCSNVLSELVTQGKVIREKEGRTSIYSVAPNYCPEPQPTVYTSDEIARKEQQIRDLEHRGLWRRALTELGNLAGMQQTAAGVSIIAQRRSQCLRKLAK